MRTSNRKHEIDYDPDDYHTKPRQHRCQCDGEHLGPCPGVELCPYSGLGAEDEGDVLRPEERGRLPYRSNDV